MMKLAICIDDTDNLESKGTGTIADELRELIEQRFNGVCENVTRHQLLIHADIPYTSHNSSMCFICDVEDKYYDELVKACYEHLAKESAPESDPGLAIAQVQNVDKELLKTFGIDAKRRILAKEEAYDTAKRAGSYLDEAGGTGQGIIGALAGVGLRLWGNDGDLKGKLSTLESERDYTVREIVDAGYIQEVRDEAGNMLPETDTVFIKWKAKPTMHNGKFTLFVTLKPDGWSTMEKYEMRKFHGGKIYELGCEHFTADVEEEQIDEKRSCYNCRYRRWMENGILCQLKDSQKGEV